MKKVIVPVLVGLLVLGGVFWFMQKDKKVDAPATNTTPAATSSDTTATTSTETTSVATITYTNSGFSPKSVTVKAGEVITVTNNSSNDLDFASNDHPTHTKESEMNIGVIGQGESKTLTITKTGTWGYHNHENASHTGTVVVQ